MLVQKDPILSSMFRRFTGTFAAVFGFLFAIFLILFLVGFSKMGGSSKDGMLEMKVHPIETRVAKPFAAKKPVILQINIEGIIGKEHITVKEIQKILAQPEIWGFSEGQVKAILLRINTPGGASGTCSEIYADLMEFKNVNNIPIHTWIGDVCASGGVYLSSTSDYISAQTVSMIGSVGVRSKANFNFYQWMQKHGISATRVTAGKDKVNFPMFSKMPAGTSSYDDIIAIVNSIYDNFLGVVVKARGSHGLTREKLIDIGASMYASEKAKELGFIDAANVRYKDSVRHLAKVVGLEEYQVISFQNAESYIDCWKKSLEAKFSFFFNNTSTEAPFSLEADFSDRGV